MKLDSSIAAVVTGGASGLGAATARQLAAHGVKVAISGLTSGKVRAFAVTSNSLAKPIPVDAELRSGAVTFVAPALSVVTIEVKK